jgi:hypothetical protein
MKAPHDTEEAWDRLTLLLIAHPREGWEDTFEEITRREIERLAPLPRQEGRNAPEQKRKAGPRQPGQINSPLTRSI